MPTQNVILGRARAALLGVEAAWPRGGSAGALHAPAAISAALLCRSLPSPGHGPAERPGDPTHSQPAGGHVGAATAREPEREHPRLQGNALSYGLTPPSSSLVGQESGLHPQSSRGFSGTLAAPRAATFGSLRPVSTPAPPRLTPS